MPPSNDRRTWCAWNRRKTFIAIIVLGQLLVITLMLPTDRPPVNSGPPVSDVMGPILAADKQRTGIYTYTLPSNFTFKTPSLSRLPKSSVPSSIICPKLFAGDKEEQEKATEYMRHNKRHTITPEEYLSMTKDCNTFRSKRGYFAEPLSKDEYEFPLAYSLLMYTDVYQVERLLRAVYMPQNFYCIHVDKRAKSIVSKAMKAIASCFPNVFVASKLVSVHWGHVSIIEAEMSCMADLLQYKWKYFINLSGQMFPMKTNAELVKILKIYNGANDIEGTFKRSQVFWMTIRQKLSWQLWESIDVMMPTIFRKTCPPYHVTIFKGSNQVAVRREFVLYLLNSPVALGLLDWFRDTLAPDEYLWPTLNHNSHLLAPGGYTGDPESKTFTVRASLWMSLAWQMNWSWDRWECQGKWVRLICIFGVGDLPWLAERPELFANKFHSSFEYLGYDCMEELHFNKTASNAKFNTSYYTTLPFVKQRDLVIQPSYSDHNAV